MCNEPIYQNFKSFSIYCEGLDGECFDFGNCKKCKYNTKRKVKKIDKAALDRITEFLAYELFRNEDIMFSDLPTVMYDDEEYELTDIIASLHNLLYEVVNGKRYNYMFHHANKAGSYCIDNIFDILIEEGD